MSDYAAKVKEIIIEKLGVDAEKVTEDASFVEDLGADSLDTVELVMDFEEEFDLEIPDEEAEKLTTVGSAIKYLTGEARFQGISPGTTFLRRRFFLYLQAVPPARPGDETAPFCRWLVVTDSVAFSESRPA